MSKIWTSKLETLKNLRMVLFLPACAFQFTGFGLWEHFYQNISDITWENVKLKVMICCFWRRTCQNAWFHNMRWCILFWLAQEFTRLLFKMHLFVSEEDKVTQIEIRPLHLKQTTVKHCISKHSRSTRL